MPLADVNLNAEQEQDHEDQGNCCQDPNPTRNSAHDGTFGAGGGGGGGVGAGLRAIEMPPSLELGSDSIVSHGSRSFQHAMKAVIGHTDLGSPYGQSDLGSP